VSGVEIAARVRIGWTGRLGVIVEPPGQTREDGPVWTDHDSRGRPWTWVLLDGETRPAPYYMGEWRRLTGGSR